MPSVGVRKNPNMGNFSKDPMYAYAASFCDVQKNILRESQVDYAMEPQRALAFKGNVDALKSFFVENCVIGDRNTMSTEDYQDEIDMMSEAFANDVQAVRENAVAGLASWNPMIGLSLPMHKYLMLNCVFAQAVPRFVAKSPSWTESIETRYMIGTDGTKIDIANQQNQIYKLWKTANAPVEVAVTLPEANSVDILDEYFKVSRASHNLSVATHISAIAVEDFAKKGDTVITIGTDGKITEAAASADGKALVWKPWKAEFTPGYGEANRIIVSPVDLVVSTDGTEATETTIHDTLFASERDNMFEINATGGAIKAVKIWARYDASSRSRRTPRVEWHEKTIFVQIPENDGITVPVTPEEVKDIGALYGINQVTKYMSMIKDVLENVKDDDIHEQLDLSFLRLDEDHKLAKTIDFAPREGYYSDHLEWLQKTFMNTLDQYVTGLLTVLRDPNMQINIIGRPGIIRQITPIEYAYQTPENVGPIALDFRKTVVTSDNRVYNFISSDKLFGNDNLIVLLIPKNTNRIVYRIYDYQMYISNEIRDAEMPQMPALSAFQRYRFFELFGVQGRLRIANPTGIKEYPVSDGDYLGYDPATGVMYANNDLGSVYKVFDAKEGRNISPEEAYAKALAAEEAANSGSGTSTGTGTGGTGTGGTGTGGTGTGGTGSNPTNP